MSAIDLHMHSIYSCDGEYTPAALVSLAQKCGIKTIAIADHNTAAGVEEAIHAVKDAKIDVVPAVELDCIHEGIVFHILGYYIDHKSPKYEKVDEDIRNQEKKAAVDRIRLVREYGIDVDTEEALSMAKDDFVTGEIIAELVLSKPENINNPLLRPYYPGGSRSDNPYVNFYWDICSQGKPAYVHIQYMSIGEAINLVNDTGGVPVLAHPGNNLTSRLNMLHDIVKLGIRGIEAYSSYHTPEQNSYFAAKAEEYGLVITCGSDFHGKNKPSIGIGQYGDTGDMSYLPETLRRMSSFYNQP
ncbi:MAG: PHP domain-containing protein [Acetivibrionales bacterium]|jgi:predicted metal-dependent phosphoesterase TrpH